VVRVRLATKVSTALIAAAAFASCRATVTTAPDTRDADVLCPDGVDGTNGQGCGAEGLICYPQYSCGVLPAIATCVCSGGHFSCKDVTGHALNQGDSPACPPATTGETCPASEDTANLAPCTAPGRLCTYPSRCRGVPAYDRCECFSGALASGTNGLRFECTSACDSTDAGRVATDAQPDSAMDAPAEAATTSDAAAADAANDVRAGDGPSD
jgi:hypothetical protein